MISGRSELAAIDRIAPTRTPTGRIVMRQNWAKLLFLHWAVPADALRPLLPPGLELDLFEDTAYVGLVPFTMTGVRPVWTPAIRHISDFHEINVRTYVHRNGEDPGVWFFSLDAANAFAVRLARVWFRLPYHYARMNLDVVDDSIASVRYTSRRLWPEPTPATCDVVYTPCGEAASAAPGTLDHFLIERYILYAFKNGSLWSGRVHHDPYPIRGARVHSLDETMLNSAGIARLDEAPTIHYSEGVSVRIYPLKRIPV